VEIVGILISLLVMFVQLGIVVGVVFFVIKATRRGEGDEHDIAGAIRRFFVYGFLLVSLVLFAEGVRGILVALIVRPSAFAGSETQVASAVSLLVVGGLVWGGLWRYVRPRLVAEDAERRSLAWMLYLNASLVVSAVIVTVAATTALRGLMTREGFDGEMWAALVVWAAVWVFHQRIWLNDRLAPEVLPILPALVGSLVGLAAGSSGLFLILKQVYESVYDLIAGVTFVAGDPWDAVATGSALLVVGGVGWGYHWFRRGARHGERSPVWFGYVLLFPVLGSVVVILAVGSAVLFDALVWFFGSTIPSASEHFAKMPWEMALVTVAATIWTYHRRVLAEHRQVRTEPDRIYDYLLAGAGLVAVGAGIAILLLALFDLVAPPLAGAEAANTLIGAITALVVGGPVWWMHWVRAERHGDETAELRSVTRRIYIFGVLGVAAIAVFVGLIVVLQGLLVLVLSRQGSFGSFKGALAALLAGGAIGAYHVQVWRTDRTRFVPAQRAAPPKDVVLVAPEAGELAPSVAEATGARVRPMTTAEGVAPDVDAVVDAIETAEASKLVVVAIGDRIEVVALR